MKKLLVYIITACCLLGEKVLLLPLSSSNLKDERVIAEAMFEKSLIGSASFTIVQNPELMYLFENKEESLLTSFKMRKAEREILKSGISLISVASLSKLTNTYFLSLKTLNNSFEILNSCLTTFTNLSLLEYHICEVLSQKPYYISNNFAIKQTGNEKPKEKIITNMVEEININTIEKVPETNREASKPNVVAYYVSVSTGKDSEVGTNSARPLKTIQRAIHLSKNQAGVVIYVAEGLYTPGVGLNRNDKFYHYSGVLVSRSSISISGGWNKSFTKRGSYSVLDGKRELGRGIFITNAYGVLLEGFHIKNMFFNDGSGRGSLNGAGLCVINSKYITISNCFLTTNEGGSKGGGIYFDGEESSVYLHSVGNRLSAYGWLYGAGMYVSGDKNYFKVTLNSNLAAPDDGGRASSGGGLYLGGEYNEVEGLIMGNLCRSPQGFSYGAGVFLGEGSGNTVKATVINNWCVGTSIKGGGVFESKESENAIVSGIVRNNRPDNFSR